MDVRYVPRALGQGGSNQRCGEDNKGSADLRRDVPSPYAASESGVVSVFREEGKKLVKIGERLLAREAQQ
jgi:hypothetical protein